MTTKLIVSVNVVCMFLVLGSVTVNGESTTATPPTKKNQCLKQLPDSCDHCRQPINVVLKATNILDVTNLFNVTAKIPRMRKQPLLHFLEKAGSITPEFNKFKSTYFKGLGYFIDSINGTEGSVANKTFWHILSGGKALECGVSSYIPENGETILFNFTTYRAAGYE